MANYFAKMGDIITIESDAQSEPLSVIPAGTYVLKAHPMKGLYLEQATDFTLPKKIYGDHEKDARRILNTFFERPKTTGVLLNGEKGSGKTLLSKLISTIASKENSVPTILINSPFSGDAFSTFLSAITQPCILLFDEFEKVYKDEAQQEILTLMDGVFTTQKLFLMTVNDKYKVNTHMRNRPGRIYYLLDYDGLDVNFIREYATDNLDDKGQVDAICNLTTMFGKFNFDMLQAIIEEVNRYKETVSEVLRLLNCKPDTDVRQVYEFELKVRGQKISHERTEGKTWVGNPMRNLSISYVNPDWVAKEDEDDDDADWQSARFEPGDIVHMDALAGIFVLKNKKGEEVIFRKEVKKEWDYRSVIDTPYTSREAYVF